LLYHKKHVARQYCGQQSEAMVFKWQSKMEADSIVVVAEQASSTILEALTVFVPK
jgi:hypothetical protein